MVIAPITNFDTTGFATIAAEIKDFEPTLYIAKKDPERFGVYFSSGIVGLTTLEKGEQTLVQKGTQRVPLFSVPGMISNSAAAFIAIKYHCLGSCITISTACASSGHAIGEAYRAIKHGYADAILAGGANAVVNPMAWRNSIPAWHCRYPPILSVRRLPE